MPIVLIRNDSGISTKELKALGDQIEKSLGLKPGIVEIPLNSTYFESGVPGTRIFDEFQKFLAQIGMGETRILGLLLVTSKEPVPIDFVEFTDDKRVILAAVRKEDSLVTSVKALHLLGHALTLRKDYDYYLQHGFVHSRDEKCVMSPGVGHTGAVTPEGINFCIESLKEIRAGAKFLKLDTAEEIKPGAPSVGAPPGELEAAPEAIEFEKAGKPGFSLRKLITRTKYRLKHLQLRPVKKRPQQPLDQIKQEEIGAPAAKGAAPVGPPKPADELVDKSGLSGDALYPVDWDRAHSTKEVADMLDYYTQQSKRRQKKD